MKQNRACAHQRAHQNVRTHIYALSTHVFTQNFTKIVVHYYVMTFSLKERCQAKFLVGHLDELGLLIGPHKSARFVWANQEV